MFSSQPPAAKILAILPQCGIGDLIQHLWYLRPLARKARGEKLTLMIKTRSMATEWIAQEPWIEAIEYLERRDLYKRALTLRRDRFDEAWIFHRSFSHALFAKAGGIPRRYGPGHGYQALVTTNPPLPQTLQKLPHLDLMMETLKQQNISLNLDDQRLPLRVEACDTIKKAYGSLPKSLIAFGVGASEMFKKWPLESFLTVAQYLQQYAPRTILLCGGPQDRQDIAHLETMLKEHNIPVIAATNWSIAESFALLSHANLYIGNDTSLLNAAAALEIPALGLFGATPKLTFSPHIIPVYPFAHTVESRAGMLAIKPDHVIDMLEKIPR